MRSTCPMHRLDDLVTIRSGGTPSKRVPDYWGGTIPWVTVKDMATPHLRSATYKVTRRGARGLALAPKGSVLVVVRGMRLHTDLPVVVCHRTVTFNQDIKCLIPKSCIDGGYLATALTARRAELLRHVNASGHGTGRLDTEFLRSTRLPLPSLSDQRRIATVIQTWDEGLRKVRALVTTITIQRRGLTGTLTSGRMSATDDGWGRRWPRHAIGELIRVVSTRGHQAQTRQYRPQGRWPIVDQSKKDLVGYTNVIEPIRGPFPLVVFGDHTRTVKRIDSPFVVGGEGVKLLYPRDDSIAPEYLHIATEVAATRLASLGYSRHFRELCQITTAVPPMGDQHSIARIADAWDVRLRMLEALQSTMQRQKDGLFRALLVTSDGTA